MRRVSDVMEHILQHELEIVKRLSVDDRSVLPHYQDWRRGCFLVARWIEPNGQGGIKIVFQVVLNHCLGASTVVAGGVMCDGVRCRDLEFLEYSTYC